jgi:hypothetical protein
MLYFDPMYLIIVGPAILLAVWAQYKVRSVYKRYLRVAASSALTGAQVARRLLDSQGLRNVEVELVDGELTDHYDPRGKVLRLSRNIYQGRSLAAYGIVAHETGHAIQDLVGYTPMKLRANLVPTANLGSNLAPLLIFIGIILAYGGAVIGVSLVYLGIIIFAAAVAFHFVTLPVEFNASSRALGILKSTGLLTTDELLPAREVLNAAALTYVAAALTAVSQLIYFLILAQRRQ